MGAVAELDVKESPIFSRTYDLLCWIIPITIKFPRQQRFVLAQAVQKTALQLQEDLIEASMVKQPAETLAQADINLAKLRTYLRLCRDLALLDMGQYEHVARMLSEIGRLLGGWKKVTRQPAAA